MAEPVETEETPVPERAISKRAVQHQAELWVEMGKTEAFQQLLAELERMGNRYRQLRFDSIMRGDAIDQREVDYERGLITGLSRPALIVSTAQAALEKATLRAEADGEEEEAKFW